MIALALMEGGEVEGTGDLLLSSGRDWEGGEENGGGWMLQGGAAGAIRPVTAAMAVWNIPSSLGGEEFVG